MIADALQAAVLRLETEFNGASAARDFRTKSSPGTPRERLLARIPREPSLRHAIDEACRLWAEQKPWPRMEPATAEFVWDRIVESRMFAQWLSANGARFDGQTEQGVLTWLLVDYWAFAGCFRWRARIDAMS